jgi:hypothetical protein
MATLTLPKPRLPTLSEFFGLFFSPTHTTHIVVGIERQAAALEAVITHQTGRADWHSLLAENYRREARDAEQRRQAAVAEAARAARVAGKLADLIA